MKEEKKTTQVTIQLPVDLYDAVRRVATEEFRTVPQQIAYTLSNDRGLYIANTIASKPSVAA